MSESESEDTHGNNHRYYINHDICDSISALKSDVDDVLKSYDCDNDGNDNNDGPKSGNVSSYVMNGSIDSDGKKSYDGNGNGEFTG